MSRQTQSYDDKAIRGEELESLATSIAQKIVDNGQVVADALDELDARTRALENRNPDVLGDAVADSLDTQVLKIGGQPIDTSAFEQVSNKVSSWQGTPDNTHYPSEKLVKDSLDLKAPLASPALTGTPTAPTAAGGTNTTQVATTEFVQSALDSNVVGRCIGRINAQVSQTNDTYGRIMSFKVASTNYSQINLVFDVFISRNSSRSRVGVLSIEALRTGATSYNNANDLRMIDDPGDILSKVELAVYYDSNNDEFNVYVRRIADTTEACGVVLSLVSCTERTGALLNWTTYVTPYTSNTSSASPVGTKKTLYVRKAVFVYDKTGSTSVPVYIGSNGDISECTDDFVHDADIAGFVTGPSSATADDIAVFDGATGKIVKDGGKKISDLALANSVVAIADGKAQRTKQSGDGWSKIAEFPQSAINTSNIAAIWAIGTDGSAETGLFTAVLNIRGSSGNVPSKMQFYISGPSSFNVERYGLKVVTRGLSSGVTVELWCATKLNYCGMFVSEINRGNMGFATTKGWTYYNIWGAGGPAPVADAENNVQVFDPEYIISKHTQTAVTDPTASGTALSFIDSITQNANGEITPTKKTVADATTSEHGLMSAADKTKLDNAVTKKTGFAYRGTSGSDVFKIAEKTYSRTASHSEQFVFNVAYSKHASNAATSELNVLLRVIKDGGSTVSVFKNTVFSIQGFSSLEWTFKAAIDDTNGKFTLYAVHTAGNYTTVEATCIAANSERNNLIDDVVVFENTTAELPETVFTETTVYAATSNASSGDAPVKVDAYGALTPVPMDSTPTASSTNLMTSGDIKTALDSLVGLKSWEPAFSPFIGDGGTDKKWAYLGKLKRLNVPSGTMTGAGLMIKHSAGVLSSNYDTYFIDVLFKPSLIHAKSSLITKIGNTNNVLDFYYRYDSTTDSLLLYAYCASDSTYCSLGVYKQTITSPSVLEYDTANVGFLPEAPTYDTKISGYIDVNIASGVGKGSTSVPVYVKADGSVDVCTDDFVHDGDVTSTYSSTGTAPVNGTAVAAALATSLTDVEYVAAQSGGGGNLNKTKNGSTTSVLAFMTTAEATSLWQSAWAAAN